MNRSSALKAPGGLQARMLVTIFLLGVVYVALVAALFAAGASGITIALVAGGLFLFQLFAADKIGLRAMGAEEVSPKEAPELHAMIERLCVQADLPKPKVAIMRTQMPNAFAMGRSKKAATVCVTTGIMEILSPAELEGVLAHELAHIRHRDVVIMTIASFFASIASMIIQFGFFFGGGDDDENPSFLVLFLVSLAVYVISFFLMSALSRYREFAADRGAAEITRRPSALSSALMKINGTMQRIPQQDLRAHSELAAFYIARPSAQSLFSLFSTHPPMERRIAELDKLEAQIQGTARTPLAA
ncbi:MAG: zinc metalloprotease HtpX [Actinomycetota bacterium]|nr:zinc metalloprotease HtpX [Actinomycetota bacterium]MDQ5807220.1 zinc metalloprotease HtpX [Actinomycetota bacterium]